MNYLREHIFGIILFAESVFLVYMALLPSGAVPSAPGFLFLRGGDLEHFIAYVIYGFLMERTLGSMKIIKNRYAKALVLASFFALGTELLQAFVPSRYPDVLDWLVDSIGCAIGSYVSDKIF